MLLRRGQALLRSARPSFAGNSLLERMRSTAFALLGITAAMALGLVAFAVQQDWSVLPAAPIPGVPEPSKVGKAGVVAEQPRPPVSGGSREEPRDQTAPRRNPAAPESSPSRLSGPRQVATASPQPTPAPEPTATPPAGDGMSPASPDPGPPPVSAPAAAPAPEPAPTPTPTSTTPPAASPSGPAPAVVSGAKEEDQDEDEADSDNPDGDDSDDRGKPSGKYKPRGGWKGGKPGKGGDAYSPDLVAPEPTSSPVEEADDSDDDSEAEDDEGDEYESSSYRGRGHGYGHGRSGR